MMLQIYIDWIFWLLIVHFYEKYLRKIGEIIDIDDSVIYYTSKLTKKFSAKMILLHIIWLI